MLGKFFNLKTRLPRPNRNDLHGFRFAAHDDPVWMLCDMSLWRLNDRWPWKPKPACVQKIGDAGLIGPAELTGNLMPALEIGFNSTYSAFGVFVGPQGDRKTPDFAESAKGVLRFHGKRKGNGGGALGVGC
jgi:hypothetical protein